MIKAIHLLIGCSFLDLISRQDSVLIDLSEDLSDSFQAKSACNHVDFVKAGVIKLNESAYFTDLGRVVDRFHIDSDALWVVWILRVVAI